MKIKISKDRSQIRIDVFLSMELDISRSQIQNFIENNRITVNKKFIKSNYKTKENDIIEIKIPESQKLDITAENIPIDILYQDKDIAIINKKAGIVVHPACGNTEGTLVNALMYHIKDLSSIGGIIRPGIVHRLDKPTSGVLIIAKNDKAHESLSKQFQNHEVKKEYLAICYGKTNDTSGVIDEPIGRSSKDRKAMSTTTKKGRNAITDWEILSSNNKFLLISLKPKTGRTHQLRVHLKFKNMPIICDETYAKTENKMLQQKHKSLLRIISRCALHAYRIEFTHPTKNKRMSFEAPIPEDFKNAMKYLSLKPNV